MLAWQLFNKKAEFELQEIFMETFVSFFLFSFRYMEFINLWIKSGQKTACFWLADVYQERTKC